MLRMKLAQGGKECKDKRRGEQFVAAAGKHQGPLRLRSGQALATLGM